MKAFIHHYERCFLIINVATPSIDAGHAVGVLDLLHFMLVVSGAALLGKYS
jgi:hypothetical protein